MHFYIAAFIFFKKNILIIWFLNCSSPQFSPAFSEPPSPWVSVDPEDVSNPSSVVVPTYNQRSADKMKADEGLGTGATISAVLYANITHPEWKTEYPNWNDRYKQIIKKWRTLSTEQRTPYLQQAKDNRSALRMKKQQQVLNLIAFVFFSFVHPKNKRIPCRKDLLFQSSLLD